jgi:hypothetical protein
MKILTVYKKKPIMEGSNINTVSIQSNQRFTEKNVVSASFNNYSAEAIIIVHKGVEIELPQASDVNGTLVPIPFRFEFAGTFFDLDITVKFPSKIGKLLIHYGIKNC